MKPVGHGTKVGQQSERTAGLAEKYPVTQLTKLMLSPAKQQLLELMQGLNFGRIEGLVVRNGEPSFDVKPRITKVLHPTGDNEARPERELPNFHLKKECVTFFKLLQQYPETTIACIEIRHGLPVRVEQAQ